MSPVTKRNPDNSRNPMRRIFEALDEDFDRWEEHYLSLGDIEARAVVLATAATRRYSNKLAKSFGLDPAYLWHAYLAWQEHWIAYTRGTTEVQPNATPNPSTKLGHLPSITRLERMAEDHPELERFIVPLERAAAKGEITQTLYLDLMAHLRAIERQKFMAKQEAVEQVRAARRRRSA